MNKRAVVLIPAATALAIFLREWLQRGAAVPAVALAPTAVMAIAASVTANGVQLVRGAREEQDYAALLHEVAELRAGLRYCVARMDQERRGWALQEWGELL